ncbi:hypothetical protein EVAR_74237_1 [Eumeta japonica]|uniref:Uncharacterized protein n=1 Tax=Eumeta variegata TaxID=151549 RepID=A0A4C1SFG7_EUMVA|nr:hypothetical protein EVAR_74237_1 [Eumeta japonica]
MSFAGTVERCAVHAASWRHFGSDNYAIGASSAALGAKGGADLSRPASCERRRSPQRGADYRYAAVVVSASGDAIYVVKTWPPIVVEPRRRGIPSHNLIHIEGLITYELRPHACPARVGGLLTAGVSAELTPGTGGLRYSPRH